MSGVSGAAAGAPPSGPRRAAACPVAGERPAPTAEDRWSATPTLKQLEAGGARGGGLLMLTVEEQLPLLPLFVVYFVSGVAETNRAPFDIAEGESEIVAGFHVEYSGMAFAVFFLAEYADMILISMLAATMFMGGWLSPFEGIPVLEELFAWVPGLVWLLAKTAFFLFIYLWIRATFPRYRYDQIMRLGWKIFIPVTLVWLVIISTAQVMDIGPWFTEQAAIAAGGA